MNNELKISRLTISLPNSTKETIEEIAQKRGLSVSAAANNLLGHGIVAELFVSSGGEVIGKDKNGKEYVIASRMGELVQRPFDRRSLLTGEGNYE